LLHDVNIIQKEVVPEHDIDISRFIAKLSKAFLPSCVMELEEYGLPRMLAKKLNASGLIDFGSRKLELHSALELLHGMQSKIFEEVKDLDSFDKYVLTYFFDGIALQQPKLLGPSRPMMDH
jgi:hypothetical protein